MSQSNPFQPPDPGQNPYGAPNANLTPPPAPSGAVNLYVVSPVKCGLLTVATFGLFLVYWMYQQWATLKAHRRLDVWPVPRALFAIFFYHQLVNEVEKVASDNRSKLDWNGLALATGIVITLLVARFSDRLMPDPGASLVVFASVIFLAMLHAQFQRGINVACLDPEASANSRFTPLNLFGFAVGGLLWLLVMIGLIMPEEPEAGLMEEEVGAVVVPVNPLGIHG